MPFYIRNSTNNQFYFKLTAHNGETILTGETYLSKQSCKDGIQSVKEHSPYNAYYRKLIASNGQYYFNLISGNNQIIGTSEMYNNSYSRDNGIASVKANAPSAAIIDET